MKASEEMRPLVANVVENMSKENPGDCARMASAAMLALHLAILERLESIDERLRGRDD